jgi:cold-inducible RNA-binding protein
LDLGLSLTIRDPIVINIFVRNLDATTIETQSRDLFAAYGPVETVTIVKGRDTNGPRSLAFVEMTNTAEARTAIDSLNGFVLNDRAMRLNEARPKAEHDSARDLSREHRRHRI